MQRGKVQRKQAVPEACVVREGLSEEMEPGRGVLKEGKECDRLAILSTQVP